MVTLPPMEFTAPAVSPADYGLYDAATVTDLPDPTPGNTPLRIHGGVHIRPVNCSESFGTWPTDPCAAPPVDTFKEGDRPSTDVVFAPIQPWAYDECDPVETDEASQALARHTLDLQERLLVESDFASTILADAGVAGTASSLVEAIGKLEEIIGEAGFTGVIHASRRWAAAAADASLLVGSGTYRTPLDNAWAFGGGYGSVLGDTLVITGPVYLWRYAPIVETALDPAINRRASVAERLIVVGYECVVAAITIT
jgi:hypothetical protein